MAVIAESVLFDIQVLTASTQQFSTAKQISKVRTGSNTSGVTTSNFALTPSAARDWQGGFRAVNIETKGGDVAVTLEQKGVISKLVVRSVLCLTADFDSITLTNESTNSDVLVSLILA